MIEKILAEIKHRIEICDRVCVAEQEKGDRDMSGYYNGKTIALEELLHFIESLEKEQDVNLEKEIYNLYDGEYHDTEDVARHFYELGCRKDEHNIELIQRSWYMEGYHDAKFKQEPKWIIKTGEGGPKYELNPRYGKPTVQKFVELASIENRAEKSEIPTNPEWSEEDETMWQNLVGWMEGSFGLLPQGKQRYIDWLKNRFVKLVHPKPSWKPSEEQIMVLNKANVVNLMPEEIAIYHSIVKDLNKL